MTIDHTLPSRIFASEENLVSRRNYWFSCEKTSVERAYKFHTDDVYFPDQDKVPVSSCRKRNFL